MPGRSSVLTLIFILIVSASGDLIAKEPPIPLATGEWSPYTSESMEGYGVFSSIVTAVFKKMGIEPEYKFYPWKRAEKMVETGEAFAAFPYIVTDKRRETFDFSDGIAFSTGLFFYTTKRFSQGVSFDNLSELKRYRIGGVLGYWYEPLFENAHIEPHRVPSEKHIIKMLYKQRLDLAPLDELVGWHLIRQFYPYEQHLFKTINNPLNHSSLHLMVSRKYPAAKKITQEFNATLKRIRQNGVYDDILRQYIPQEK